MKVESIVGLGTKVTLVKTIKTEEIKSEDDEIGLLTNE